MALRATRVVMLAARSQSSSCARAKAKSATPSVADQQVKKVSPLMRPLRVSPDLRNFLGVSEIARAEAVKKIWDYIKSNDLQDPANRREILCDAKLKVIFDGKDRVTMFEMGKLLNPHFLKDH